MKEGGGCLGALLTLFFLAATLPALAHVLLEIVQWSWRLIG